MTLILNGEKYELIGAKTSISALLEKAGYADKIVAVAVNGIFIAKANYEAHGLNDGDRVEIVAPMQGG